MRFIALFSLVLATTPALADQPMVHRGQVLRDANKARLGVIDSIANDGTVGLVIDGTYARVPAQTISLVDGKPTTTLIKHDLLKR